jgi:hypothetical protein
MTYQHPCKVLVPIFILSLFYSIFGVWYASPKRRHQYTTVHDVIIDKNLPNTSHCYENCDMHHLAELCMYLQCIVRAVTSMTTHFSFILCDHIFQYVTIPVLVLFL